MSNPRELRNHEPARLPSRDPPKRVSQPRTLKRALMRPVTLADNLQQAQTPPLALIRDLIHLPAQLVLRTVAIVRFYACVPDYRGPPLASGLLSSHGMSRSCGRAPLGG